MVCERHCGSAAPLSAVSGALTPETVDKARTRPANLALIRSDSPARAPILSHISAIDTEGVGIRCRPCYRSSFVSRMRSFTFAKIASCVRRQTRAEYAGVDDHRPSGAQTPDRAR